MVSAKYYLAVRKKNFSFFFAHTAVATAARFYLLLLILMIGFFVSLTASVTIRYRSIVVIFAEETEDGKI